MTLTGFRVSWMCFGPGTSLRSSIALMGLADALFAAGCGSSGPGDAKQPAPSNLSYPSSAIAATVGKPISTDTPTVTGTVTGYAVSPALPAGLALDAKSGAISGTPTAAVTKTNYTVTASNSGGSATATVSIVVNPVAPAGLSYAQASIVAQVGTAITADTPTVTGTVSSYTISPALPAGLGIDPSSGAISGTPTAASAQATYTVTAANAGGSTTAQIQVTVLNGSSTLVNLGHASGIVALFTDGTHVMSEDGNGHWVLWDYATGSIIGSGNGAEAKDTNGIALAGPTAISWDGANVSIYSTSDGHLVATVPAASNGGGYKLATDGSYVVTYSSTALTVYTAAGTQEFSHSGDYSLSNVFAAPAQVEVALGAAGQNVIENISVPSGTSAVTPSFNGTFSSWFTDGQRFLSNVGTTILTYSSANAAQQGALAGGGAAAVGQGNWISLNKGLSLEIYAVGSTTATQTYALGPNGNGTIVPSGLQLGVFDGFLPNVSVVDLSGAAPVKTDYKLPSPLYPNWLDASVPQESFAASSASTWLLACNNSVILDGGSLNTKLRLLNYGAALSIAVAGNTAAIATESGQTLIYDLTGPKLTGTIPRQASYSIYFPETKLGISSDGSVLAAMDFDSQFFADVALSFYSLPSMTQTATSSWNPATEPNTYLQDFSLSGSGTEVGELLGSAPQMNHPDGSAVLPLGSGAVAPFLSPDGSLAAVTTAVAAQTMSSSPQTNLFKNGTLVTAVSAIAEGWIDNNHLLAATYTGSGTYAGSTIYDATGATVATFTASQIPPINMPSFLPGGLVYAPGTNAVYSLTTGNVTFQGPSDQAQSPPLPGRSVPVLVLGAAGSSEIVYESTSGAVKIVPFQ